MISGYQLIVKRKLNENFIEYSLPEHIQRGWNRVYIDLVSNHYYVHSLLIGIYTLEEQQFNLHKHIIGPDVSVPNSIVRQRLGTKDILIKTNAEILSKAFELPDRLLMHLSNEHKLPEKAEEEKVSFEWNDEDNDNNESKHKKLMNKRIEKRRKFDEYDYDLEALSLNNLIEEMHRNIGRDLNNQELKLIESLVQIISRSKNNQILNIYDEFTNAKLIRRMSNTPKIVEVI